MNHLFLEKLASVKHDKGKLLGLLNDIDATKRSTKNAIVTLIQKPKMKGRPAAVELSNKLKRMLDKTDYLDEEREAACIASGKLKLDQKVMNKAIQLRTNNFVAPFLATAELELWDGVFVQIETRVAVS